MVTHDKEAMQQVRGVKGGGDVAGISQRLKQKKMNPTGCGITL